MKAHSYFKYLLFLIIFSTSVASADIYVELSPSLIEIDTPAATTRPLLADIRLGYAILQHQLELAVMTGVKDDSLNQLTVDVPSVVSILYHYLPYPDNSLKLHLILGASQVKVDSSYPGTADTSDSFSGVSYGIGFEESFKSLPQFKLTLDWIQLYRGEDIDINALSFGAHYEF